MQKLWGKAERDGKSHLQARCDAFASGHFLPSGRSKIALASVLTKSLRFLKRCKGEDGEGEETLNVAAQSCMSSVPDFILRDPCREVQLEVSKNCISVLFDCFDDHVVFEELRPLLDFSNATLVTGNLPNSCALVAFQVAISISCCQGYMHRVLPAFCASPPAVLRPMARKALRVLDEELGITTDELSPLALTFRAPIFQSLLKAEFAKKDEQHARNDVITNQLSQKQRVLLEKFMVDNAGTSAAQGHSEVKALAPAAGKSAPNEAGCECETSPRQTPDSSHGNCLLALPAKKRTRSSFDAICNEPATSSTMQASTPQSLTSGTSETCGTTICKKAAMDEMPGKGSNALAVPKSKPGRRPDVRMTKAKPAGKMKAKDKKAFNAKARSSCGNVKKGSHSSLYLARIRFYSLEMHTGNACDLKTALEDLMVLTAVKQKMRNQTGAGTFVERLQAAIVSSAAEHGRSLTDLKLGFHVCQSARSSSVVSG
eukprot:symbB.v1.2.029033.t1/scaffold3135.1/size62805/3